MTNHFKHLFLILFLLISSISHAQTSINSQIGKERLLGKHFFMIQWLSDAPIGEAEVTEKNDTFYISGKQSGVPSDLGRKDDFVSIDGIITNVKAREFTFKGKIIVKSYGDNNGQSCVRNGTMTFFASGTRKYWRLQEMQSPCDSATDYVDLYFKIDKYPLTIETQPADAKIRILNIAPEYVSGMLLAQGKYHIEVTKDGYQPKKEWVNLSKQTQNFNIKIDAYAAKANLTVRSNLNGDTVLVDGQNYGASKVTQALPLGEHKVTVQKYGFTSYQTTIDLQKNTTIKAKLSPLALNFTQFPANWNDYIDRADARTLRETIDKRYTIFDKVFTDTELQNSNFGTPEFIQLKSLINSNNLSLEDIDLSGDWKCRTFEFLDSTTQPADVFFYAYYKCRFSMTDKGPIFEKLSGSYRVKGYLYANAHDELILLGSAEANNNPQTTYSGIKGESHVDKDQVGSIRRKGDNILIMQTPNEIYELVR